MKSQMLKKLLLLITVITIVATFVCIFGASASAVEGVPADKTLIDLNTEWRYLDNDTDPADGLDNLTAWTKGDFDDSSWKTGVGSLGTKKGAIAKIEGVTPNVLLNYYREDGTSAIPSYFFRTKITVDDFSAYNALVIEAKFDDSIAIYINGTVVYDTRRKVPADTNLNYVGTKDNTRSVSMCTPLSAISSLQEGENVIAVEIHNELATSSDALLSLSRMALTYVEPAKVIDESVVLTVGKDVSERNLAWFSNISAAGEVRLTEASDVVNGVFPNEYFSFVANSATATNAPDRYAKRATITGLEEDTVYAYMIVCGDLSGEVRYFKTGTADSSYDFVFVGDPQLSTKAHGNQWQDTLQKIEQNFAPELLISAGDQVSVPDDETQYGYLIKDELAGFTFAPTVGPGHDSKSGVAASFSDHFYLPNLSTEYGVGITSSNYWYTYKNTLFMHLNMEDANALYNGEHKAFISEVMKANPDVKWTILVAHRAPFSTGLHGDPNDKNYEKETALIRPALSALATEMDIDIVLSGHDHVYVRTHMLVNEEISADVIENNTVVNPTGVLYVAASSSSASKFYSQRVTDAYFVAKENYENRKSAIKFEVTDTSLTMTSYFLDDMSVFDTFTIEKPEHVCTLSPVEETPATCKHEGKHAYYECSCGKAYEDADGKVLISDLATWGVIAKKDTHTPTADDGDCTTAVICSVCSEVTTPANASHTGGTATCKEKAECSVCGKEYGNFALHSPMVDDGDCTTEIICSVCSEVTTPANASHTGGTATCKEKAECSVCGKEYGNFALHSPMADDGDCTTAVICSVCGEATTPASTAHLDANKDGNCDVCPYAFSTTDQNSGSGESSFGLIVGIIIGSVSFACIVAFVLFKFVIKKKTILK